MSSFQAWLKSQANVAYLTPKAMAEAAWNAALEMERGRVAELEAQRERRNRQKTKAPLTLLPLTGLPVDLG